MKSVSSGKTRGSYPHHRKKKEKEKEKIREVFETFREAKKNSVGAITG